MSENKGFGAFLEGRGDFSRSDATFSKSSLLFLDLGGYF